MQSNLNFIIIAEIPENDYIEFFKPDYSLKIPGGHIVWKSFVIIWLMCYAFTNSKCQK